MMSVPRWGKSLQSYGIGASSKSKIRLRTQSIARRKLPPQGVHNGQTVCHVSISEQSREIDTETHCHPRRAAKMSAITSALTPAVIGKLIGMKMG